MSNPLKTTTWVQLVPVFGNGYVDGRYQYGTALVGVRAARMTQKRPEDPLPGAALARIQFVVPTVVFDPVVDATLEIEADQVATTTVSVGDPDA